MQLVIVESPSKAKTIEKYLGKGYKVLASKGHIVDLPKSDLGIDVDHKFKPTYVVTKKEALKTLKDAFKDADGLILAVDPDREGEAIGWHIAKQLKVINEKGDIVSRDKGVKRIVFTEITKDAIDKAIKSPRGIDINLVDAQQARRVLDRLVGYKLSPLLWKKIRFGLSAGRVQSVAVKLIVDRERERDAFNAEEYWKFFAWLDEKKSGTKPELKVNLSEDEKIEPNEKLLNFELNKINNKKPDITKQSEIEDIYNDVKDKEWKISEISSKEVKRTPKPPFTTSTLQQYAANRYGMSSKQTMALAQKLYEAGHITYMRTDSTNLSQTAITAVRSYIEKKLGKDYLPEKPKYYKASSKVSQEAHEAIRPTDFKKTSVSLKLDASQQKIYQAIWERALGSQMQDAKLESSQIKINIGKYIFQLNGQRILFPGYLEIYSEKVSENILPKVSEGDVLNLDTALGTQHFTSPPPRYTEASLIKTLEANGIGRPSTYAPIISTIQVRKYVVKENKYFIPTDTGIVVTKLLEKHFEEIVDPEFTSKMEDSLDNIADGNENWIEMMTEFYKPFITKLEKKDAELKREDFTVLGPSDWKCPECGKKMDIKLGRHGRFLSCSNFPECKGMRGVDGKTEAETAQEAYSKEFLNTYKSAPKTDDGRDYLLKTGRYGKFWAHPDYPKVKDAKPLEYTDKIFKKIYGPKPKAKDGKKMVLRNGRFGEFWAHPNYPDKKEVIRIDKKKTAEVKKELGLE